MADYIDRDAFLADRRAIYCADCNRRKGMKNGKMKTLYEIGEAPCRSCGIGDVLDDAEYYPAADVVTWEQLKKAWQIATADVVEVVRCRECRYYDPDDGGCKVNAVSGLTDDNYCSWGEAKDG